MQLGQLKLVMDDFSLLNGFMIFKPVKSHVFCNVGWSYVRTTVKPHFCQLQGVNLTWPSCLSPINDHDVWFHWLQNCPNVTAGQSKWQLQTATTGWVRWCLNGLIPTDDGTQKVSSTEHSLSYIFERPNICCWRPLLTRTRKLILYLAPPLLKVPSSAALVFLNTISCI